MGELLIYTASRHGSRITKSSLPTAARYAENILSEAAVKKKYHFDDATWESLGSNDALVEAIEAEKVRRIRNGSTKRERATATNWNASARRLGRHYARRQRVAEASDQLSQSIGRACCHSQRTGKWCQRRIDLSSKLILAMSPNGYRYRSISINPDDIDPYNNKPNDTDDTDPTPQELLLAAIATNKKGNDGEWRAC